MCGICGVVAAQGQRVDRGLLERMTATLVHRGPDASGVALPEPRVGLGHRRLSIIDLARGAQPMASGDRKVWITFNGEIFNYRELREELRARGRVFTTQSDTEVLLALYELDGDAGLTRLRGQFAFAIWDGRPAGGRLVLMRDPLGIKPLYFCFAAGTLWFASEPRALLAHPGVDRSIDEYGLHLFLRYRFIPAPHTAWRQIRKLRPGERLVLENGALSCERVWRVRADAVECDGDLEAARRELGAALPAAVRAQRVADVPVGAFLSGGIDSSTMAALLARCSEPQITTFTIGFDDARYDESAYADEVARHIGSHHRLDKMGASAAGDVIDAILAHLDEPFGDPSLVPTWMLCRHAARHHKVVLSGDGGDELFGGYGRIYRALGMLALPRALRPLWRPLQRAVAATRDPRAWRGDDRRVDREYVRLLADVRGRDAARLYGPRLRPCLARERRADDPIAAACARHGDLPPFSRILLADIEAHLADYHLVKVDRAAMAHGLEVRVPFLDQDLVERAFRWTAAVRLSGGRTKGLLRDVVAAWVPPAVLTREKQGFGPPLGSWFQGGLGAFARDHLRSGAAVDGGWVRRAEVESMLDPRRLRAKGSRLWRLLVLEHWLRRAG